MSKTKIAVEEYPDYDWDKIPSGSPFKALIEGAPVKGRIYKIGGVIYLCQNLKNGYNSPNKLGYEFSWRVSEGESRDLEQNRVTNLEVWLPEAGYKTPVEISKFGTYLMSIYKDSVTVGCTTVSFEQVEAVYEKMLALRKADKSKTKSKKSLVG